MARAGRRALVCTCVHLLSLVENETSDRTCYSTFKVHRVLGNIFCLCEHDKLYFRILIGIRSFLGWGMSRRKVKPWDWRDYSQTRCPFCLVYISYIWYLVLFLRFVVVYSFCVFQCCSLTKLCN